MPSINLANAVRISGIATLYKCVMIGKKSQNLINVFSRKCCVKVFSFLLITILKPRLTVCNSCISSLIHTFFRCFFHFYFLSFLFLSYSFFSLFCLSFRLFFLLPLISLFVPSFLPCYFAAMQVVTCLCGDQEDDTNMEKSRTVCHFVLGCGAGDELTSFRSS